MKTFLSRFNFDYFFTIPPETQIVWFWLGFFFISVVVTIIIFLILRAKGTLLTPYRKYAKNYFWPNFSLNLIGLFFAFSRYEKLALLSWRFWIYFILLLVISFNAYHFVVGRGKLEEELVAFHNKQRKNKWLAGSKKK